MEATCHPRLGVVSDKQMVQWTFVASSDHREGGGLRNQQPVLFILLFLVFAVFLAAAFHVVLDVLPISLEVCLHLFIMTMHICLGI